MGNQRTALTDINRKPSGGGCRTSNGTLDVRQHLKAANAHASDSTAPGSGENTRALSLNRALKWHLPERMIQHQEAHGEEMRRKEKKNRRDKDRVL